MKRMVCCLLALSLMLVWLPVSASAAEVTEKVIYLEDGSYITVTIEEWEIRASGTKNGSKKYTYTTDGTTRWQAVLSGSFTYTGSTATCTSSSCSVTIYDSAFSTDSKSASKSGNTAYGTATVARKAAGITMDKHTANISLACDANGNLS